MKAKVKKISKYVLNFLNMFNMILLGLAKIYNWNVTNLEETIILITAVISTWLVSGKIFEIKEK